LGARVAGELGEEVAAGLLGVFEAAGLELGLAEGGQRGSRFGVEKVGLAERGDGGVALLFPDVGETETEVGARIVWFLGV
jgi:hypothetical protein